MKLSATHAFNRIVLRVKFGLTSYEDIPPALTIYSTMAHTCLYTIYGIKTKLTVQVELIYQRENNVQHWIQLSLTVRCTNTMCQKDLYLMAIVAYATGFGPLVLKNNHPSKVGNIVMYVPKMQLSF